MAGKRQHFLPRLLTSGFASRRTGKEAYTYVFEPGCDPREENIINVATEGYFYGRESSIDPALTQLESDSFGPLVTAIRSQGAVPLGAEVRIAEFVASLVLRTRNMREVLRDVGVGLGSALSAQYANHEAAKRELRRCIDENPEIVLKPVLEHYGVTRIASIPTHRRLQILNHFRTLLDREAPRFSAQIVEAVDDLHDRLQTKDYIQSLHLNALERDVVGQARAEQLRTLEWSILIADPGTFVLGDIGPIRFDGCRYDMLLEVPAAPQLVLLPVSDRHLVVGRSANTPAFPEPEELNRAAAELSYEFLIASRNTLRERGYAGLIGRGAHAVWKNAASGVGREVDVSRIEADIREAAERRLQTRESKARAAEESLVDPADPPGSLNRLVGRVADRIAAAEPVYFNRHLKGWIKRKMWLEEFHCEITRQKPRSFLGTVTFECRLQQSGPLPTKQEAVAATTAPGSVSEPKECRITYVARNGRWVVERREYRSGVGGDDEWHSAPVDEPKSWPTVLLLMF